MSRSAHTTGYTFSSIVPVVSALPAWESSTVSGLPIPAKGCYFLPRGRVFSFLNIFLLTKRRGDEIFVFAIVTALFEFETNAPAFVPLFVLPPAKRQRRLPLPKENNPEKET
jgi:hypothetical protein